MKQPKITRMNLHRKKLKLQNEARVALDTGDISLYEYLIELIAITKQQIAGRW